MTGGTLPMTSAQVKAVNASITTNVATDVALNATTTTVASNGNAQFLASGDVNITASTFSLVGGAAPNSIATVTTSNGGDINITLTGAFLMQGGSSSVGSSESSLIATKGGDITLSGTTFNLLGGTGVTAPVQILTGVATGNGNIAVSGSSITALGVVPAIGNAQVKVFTGWVGQGNITLTSGGNINLTQTLVKANGATGTNLINATAVQDINLVRSLVKTAHGNTSLQAGDSITFDTASEVNAGGSQAVALFVVDTSNAMTGSFTFPVGSKIIANQSIVGQGFVRIYTVSQMLNTIPTGVVINGLPYSPSTMDTNNEVFMISYPTLPAAPQDGSDHFTIYYKTGP